MTNTVCVHVFLFPGMSHSLRMNLVCVCVHLCYVGVKLCFTLTMYRADKSSCTEIKLQVFESML